MKNNTGYEAGVPYHKALEMACYYMAYELKTDCPMEILGCKCGCCNDAMDGDGCGDEAIEKVVECWMRHFINEARRKEQ